MLIQPLFCPHLDILALTIKKNNLCYSFPFRDVWVSALMTYPRFFAEQIFIYYKVSCRMMWYVFLHVLSTFHRYIVQHMPQTACRLLAVHGTWMSDEQDKEKIYFGCYIVVCMSDRAKSNFIFLILHKLYSDCRKIQSYDCR